MNQSDNLTAKDLDTENLDAETDESIGEYEVELYEDELNELNEPNELDPSGNASDGFEEGQKGGR